MEEVYKTTPVQAAFSNPFASAFGNLMPASSAPAAPDPFVAAFGNLMAKPSSPDPASNGDVELAEQNGKEE